ncbi:MAG: hypothetical protein J6J23_03485 [Clostridia bacterium]|nr:hypothetical protein [Clostridia bacterium]
MAGKHNYCPICGETQFGTNVVCVNCHSETAMAQSIYDYEYYQNQSMEKYGDFTHWKEFLLLEIEQNPLYNPNAVSCKSNQNIAYNSALQVKDDNIPKCPTCSSTNIQKISATSKVVGASLFGLFSKTATSQFKCNNCGYKW